MSWRSTAQILIAFAAASLTIWFSPALLAPLGLGQFTFVLQLCAAILALSVLEAIFGRLPGLSEHE
jgi:hypothetical protein